MITKIYKSPSYFERRDVYIVFLLLLLLFFHIYIHMAAFFFYDLLYLLVIMRIPNIYILSPWFPIPELLSPVSSLRTAHI